jgi:hypothetical protein
MKMLLDKRDVQGAFQFVKNKCMELVDGKVSLGQLTVTKSLRADYANPERIAHKALADRVAKRDPGNAPAAGDRIGYVYIRPKDGEEASKLQGERIETILFIKENGLTPDYRHYIEHQLQNPISQAFGLLLEMIPGFHPSMVYGCPTAKDDLDRYLIFRERVAAELLFHECLHSDSIVKMESDHKKSLVRSGFTSLFGKNVVIAPINPIRQAITQESASRPVTRSTTKVVQTTMSNFMLDSMLMQNVTKKQRAVAAAKKKAKEEEISSK